jgi:hypothetical protein
MFHYWLSPGSCGYTPVHDMSDEWCFYNFFTAVNSTSILYLCICMCSVVEKFLNMPLDEKRKHYRSSIFYTVDKISTWQEYFLKSKERLKMQCKLFIYVYMLLLLYVFHKFFVF